MNKPLVLDSPIESAVRLHAAAVTKFCAVCKVSLGLVDTIHECVECKTYSCGSCGPECRCRKPIEAEWDWDDEDDDDNFDRDYEDLEDDIRLLKAEVRTLRARVAELESKLK